MSSTSSVLLAVFRPPQYGGGSRCTCARDTDSSVPELTSPDVSTSTSQPRTYERAAGYGYDSQDFLLQATSEHLHDQSSASQSKCESLPAMTVPQSSSQLTLTLDSTIVKRYCVHYQWPNNHTHH